MIISKEIIEFIRSHKGKTISYGNGYNIQVYNGDVLQANISYNSKEPFIKIEQRENKSITLFLERRDDNGIIDYSYGCKLMEDDPIINLYEKFKDHPKIENILIALLELR